MAKRRSKTRKPRSTSKTRKSKARMAEVPRRMPHYEGPEEWLLPQMEETLSKLGPKEEIDAIPDLRPGRARAPKAARAPRAKAKGGPAKATPFRSTYQEGKGEGVLADVPRTFWQTRFAQFHRRRVAHAKRVAAVRSGPPGAMAMPAIPGVNNWTPLGPS